MLSFDVTCFRRNVTTITNMFETRLALYSDTNDVINIIQGVEKQ